MKLKAIICIFSILSTTILSAETLLDVIVEAEKTISKKYPTEMAQKYAKQSLAEILENNQLSEDEKIHEIKKKYLFEEYFQIYFKLAQKGSVEAQYNLGQCYCFGYGVAQNLAEAAKWYRKAAEKGLAMAQYHLALCYANGYGVKKDYTEAVKWYRKSAKQGVQQAQKALKALGKTW